MPAPRLFCIRFEHNDQIQTFPGRRTICLSSRMTCLSSRIPEDTAHGRKFFRPLATARLMAQAHWEGFDIPIAEMDEPIWQTKLPPQLSDWCILARCTNYQFSTIMWEKLRRPTTHSRTSQVAHRIVCSPMLMIGWTNHFLWPVSECRTFWGAKLRRSTHWQKISVNLSPISSFMRTWYPQKIRHLGTKCCTECT